MFNQVFIRFFSTMLVSLTTLFWFSLTSAATPSGYSSESDSIQPKKSLSNPSPEVLSSEFGGGSTYLIGSGIYDITGPAGEVVMMGYADETQTTEGIHLRLRSRAFIVGDGTKRVVFVSADLGMLFQMVKLKVCEKIANDPDLLPYYNVNNVLLSATHTHNGPGGYSGHFLYDATIKGFVRQNFNAIVDGIYQSIKRAHNNLQEGKILINQGTIEGLGGNRAVEAYNNNPADERTQYSSNTDQIMTLLKFVAMNGEEIGTLNWYAVHADSIGPDNHLISGDNKGWAAYKFEKLKGTDYSASRTFVAAFAQTDAGDVTPNIGYGPAPKEVTLAENPSLENAVNKQYSKAVELYNSATEELSGSVDFRHEWVDMRTLYVESVGTTTCPGAMGASFSAGSPFDNPSPASLFPNGTTVDSVNWDEDAATATLSSILNVAFLFAWPETNDPVYQECHAKKPILIPTGVAHLNIGGSTMTPNIVPLQVLKIGNLAIAASPNEVTTMAGRRIRNTIISGLESTGVKYSVVAALANTYTSYMATREEYAMQWYEGASTQFGPNELAAFRQEYRKLCAAIANGTTVEPGPTPEDITAGAVDFSVYVAFDDVPMGKNFGDVEKQPDASYKIGDRVSTVFWGAHPNNDFMIQDTFLVVEKLVNGKYEPVARDWDPETTFNWARDFTAYSKVTITWDTADATAGTYRIRHKGNRKSFFGDISPYEGVTYSFTLQ